MAFEVGDPRAKKRGELKNSGMVVTVVTVDGNQKFGVHQLEVGSLVYPIIYRIFRQKHPQVGLVRNRRDFWLPSTVWMMGW